MRKRHRACLAPLARFVGCDMPQSVFSIITPIEDVELVEAALDSWQGCPAGTHPDLPLGRLPMLHFASVIVSADPHYQALIFENNIDGTVDDYLRTLVALAPRGLNRLYAGCRGYPKTGGPSDRHEVVKYFARTLFDRIFITWATLARQSRQSGRKIRSGIESTVISTRSQHSRLRFTRRYSDIHSQRPGRTRLP